MRTFLAYAAASVIVMGGLFGALLIGSLIAGLPIIVAGIVLKACGVL